MVTLQKDSEKQIGQFVAEDYRTAAVFQNIKLIFAATEIELLMRLAKKKE